jgi:hypothetical protein
METNMTRQIFDFPACGQSQQGDIYIAKLSDGLASELDRNVVLKAPTKGALRLLEGEMTGHFHEVVQDCEHEDDSKAIAVAALAIAKARASVKIGSATLYRDDALARRIPWLTRTDLMIGLLAVDGGSVVLQHPEHDGHRLLEGVYYIGRQVESAGAAERVVAD